MKVFYFTFGSAHPLRNMVQKVYADDEDLARRVMCKYYGNKWAFCYGPFEDGEREDGKHAKVGSTNFIMTEFSLRGDDMW